MKGVILSLPARNRKNRASVNFTPEIFVRRYLGTVVFTLFFTAGVIWGAFTSLKSDPEFLLDMDFLFTTNLNPRLDEGLLGSFMAHFASNFIFFTAVFLCGLSPWGIGVLPLTVTFKGFGTGLSAAYLMSTYGLKGLGFYIVVVLPGTFVFSLVLIFMCSESSRASLRIARCIFSKVQSNVPVAGYVKSYLMRCVYYLLMAAVGAVCDMFFWSFVSRLFF